MAFDFTGKTAIVTGGTQGIGLEIAKGIVAGGGHVALIARNAAKGEAAVAELGEGNKFYQLDVADAPKARETVEQIFTDLPQTNILINCAGVISTKKFDEIDDTEWRRTIDINLNGTYRTGRIAHEIMREHGHGGSLIFTASLSGHNANYMMGSPTPVNAYGATKAAIMEHSRYLAAALAKDGIRSNTISPGYVWSGIFNGRIDMPGHDAMLEVVPMHRFGTNDEIASTVLFLASDASSYVTGTDIRVDGGYSVF